MKKKFNNEKNNLIKLFKDINIQNLKNFKLLCSKSISCIKKNKKIIFAGNGGSAADSQHLAAELVVRYKKNRNPIASISLTTDTSILTATSNDYNFDYIFSRQIEALGNKGDIFIALTTSGNSKNLIHAVNTCKKKGILAFCLSGNKGGKIKKKVNYPIIINSNETSIIQVAQKFLGHVYCDIIEDYFSKLKNK